MIPIFPEQTISERFWTFLLLRQRGHRWGSNSVPTGDTHVTNDALTTEPRQQSLYLKLTIG